MLIKLDRSTMPAPYQESLWGVHAGKVWAALRGGCSRQHSNPDTVYGMVLSSMEIYAESGVYIQFDVGSKREGRWLNSLDATSAKCEQHTVYADNAIWLWMVLGTCARQYLVPNADLFHLIPASLDIRPWDRPWQQIAAIMCKSLCNAVARDEYSREGVC